MEEMEDREQKRYGGTEVWKDENVISLEKFYNSMNQKMNEKLKI